MSRALLFTKSRNMKNKKFLFLMILITLTTGLFSFTCIAQPKEEEEAYKTDSTSRDAYEEITKKKTNFNVIASITQGYDTNATLDSEREGDFFNQANLDLDLIHEFYSNVKVKFAAGATDINYYDVTDANFLDAYAGSGLIFDFLDVLSMETLYKFSEIYYHKDKQGTYLTHEAIFGLKHAITDSLYHKVEYEIMYKHFDERQARDAAGTQVKDRKDLRHTVSYQITKTFTKTLFKVKGTFFHNDSNDKYLDYYDYNSYKASGSLIQLLTEKLYIIGSVAYEFKDFKDRYVSDIGKKQEDDVYFISAALFYDLTANLSVGADYTYIKNDSNDPLEDYTDNLFTTGLYYTF